MRVLHTEKFAGDTLTAVRYGPDVQVKINGRDFGIYTTIKAGIQAAKDSITLALEKG